VWRESDGLADRGRDARLQRVIYPYRERDSSVAMMQAGDDGFGNGMTGPPGRRRPTARPLRAQSTPAGHLPAGRFAGVPGYMRAIEMLMSRVPTVTAAASKEGALKKPIALLLKP
jgi:hypothetical protein